MPKIVQNCQKLPKIERLPRQLYFPHCEMLTTTKLSLLSWTARMSTKATLLFLFNFIQLIFCQDFSTEYVSDPDGNKYYLQGEEDPSYQNPSTNSFNYLQERNQFVSLPSVFFKFDW